MAAGVHLWGPVRAFLTLWLYLHFVGVFTFVMCVLPGRALALVSPSSYARVVAQAEWIADVAFRKAATSAVIGQAAAASTSPVAVAARVVTGPLGWATLGVGAGLLLWQTYYNQNDLTAIKNTVASQNGGGTVTRPDGVIITVAGGNWCQAPSGTSCTITQANGSTITKPIGFDAMITVTETGTGCSVITTFGGNTGNTWQIVSGGDLLVADNPPSGSSSNDVHQCTYAHLASSQQFAFVPSGDGQVTPDQVATHVQNLPASDPNSVENHTQPAGLGKDAPAPPGAQVTTVPVSPTEVTTEVKPATQVAPDDVVVRNNVPPPAGTTTTQTATQQTTTQTTTNPDGSTTEDQTATTACSSADHDQRTFGSVLEEHQAKWNNAPLLAAVNQLKTLTWPSALPVVSFSSVLFGSFQVDFNAWAWVFLALKTLLLAGASFAAYRIVFVGGR